MDEPRARTAGMGPPSPRPDLTWPVADSRLRFTTWDVTLLAICGAVWGIAYVFIRQGIVLGASPLVFAAVRYLLSAAAFALIAAVRREPLPSAEASFVSAIVGGLLVIGFYGGLLYWGEQYTTGGYAAVLSPTAPILSVVFARSLLPHERLSPRSLAGLFVGLVGVAVLVAPTLAAGPGGGWEGPLFVLGAFVCTASGTVLLRRFGGGRQGLWQIGTQFAVAAAVLGAAALVLPVREALPDTAGVWTALAALVVLSSVVGYFTYFALHHRVGPVRANSVTYIVPLVGIATGAVLLGEPVTVWEIAGFLVVVTGLTLVVRGTPRSAG